MVERELDDLWFGFESIPGASFKLNDSVRIKSGECAGEYAAVVSLLTLEPSPVYLVELSSCGKDVTVAETELEGPI
jgi:hypothetical protein